MVWSRQLQSVIDTLQVQMKIYHTSQLARHLTRENVIVCQQFQKTSQIASVASRAEIPVTLINLNCLKIPSTYSSTIHSKDGGKFHQLDWREGGGEKTDQQICVRYGQIPCFFQVKLNNIYTQINGISGITLTVYKLICFPILLQFCMQFGSFFFVFF